MTGVSAVTIEALPLGPADLGGGHKRRHSWRMVRGADEAWPVRLFWYMYGSSRDGRSIVLMLDDSMAGQPQPM